MRRLIFRILTTFSLAMFVLCVGLCIYSFFEGKVVVHTSTSADGTGGASFQVGGVCDGWCVLALMESPMPGATADDWEVNDITMEEIWDIETDLNADTVRVPGAVFFQINATGFISLNGWVLVIHFGWLIPLFGILPTIRLLNRHKEPRRRARLGLCIACGYDLRGSETGACPECGTVR